MAAPAASEKMESLDLGVTLTPPGEKFKSISIGVSMIVGFAHNCALREDVSPVCWQYGYRSP